MFPPRLQPGDEIRIIAPSTSMAVVKGKQLEIAQERLETFGFRVTYGKYVEEHDEFFSTSIQNRVEDLHDAFSDPNVKAILTAIGGYNVNQILTSIDYNVIQKHPKILCGYSDITALQLAIYKKTGLITYSGPHFSTFGNVQASDYTIQNFLTALTNDAPFDIEPSSYWSDDKWYLDQAERNFHPQGDYFVIQEGSAEGRLIGGNLCTMNLLQGTEFMPSLDHKILFIEDDEESHPLSFDRDLQSLLHLPSAKNIQAILIGRFQKGSNMTDTALSKIIKGKPELKDIPIIANVNFGHTDPIATIPIGGKATVIAKNGKSTIHIEP
ncbi:muramoyltetrapeptide carboxypeptidase LdcA involved in peptidoglycan recycling [Oikeobacillus pervagus]|uniref:Muramoyltetrapeptide carboxypeptidase LdcA involved in peptidoglycan recycling n=1 Tax=Oikeobacillus pervagus TaxID=1325931 RepID=A0AAJ1T4L1_9BACI|nr:S66 peptidase family protein [Oikeobacillus pervagus]MDQ0215121.1 muramoyltetrapeptide carboxypeptidase LdcA involved in peptidoglycan recycling [Oikeobacillus pervagus]